MWLILLIVIFTFTLVSFIRQYFIRKQHPPGPLGFPFVGQIPFQLVGKVLSMFGQKISLPKYFEKMKKTYGDIWSIDLGSKRMVVLASADLINEAFLENAKLFSGRPKYEMLHIISEDRGIIFIDGELAQNNRHLSVKALRDLGMGKKHMEGKICNEIDELIEIIEQNLSKPLKSPEIFVKAVSNVISLLTFDVRNKYNDPKFEEFIENMKRIAHSNEAHELMELFGNILDKKYLKRIFPAVEDFIRSNEEFMKFVSNKCRSRIKIESEFSKPNCIFDYFWKYRYQNQPEIDPQEKFLNISHSMLDIFVGGTDTTTNMLAFSCLILGQHQDLQDELRTEIQSFVDDYKLISMEMRKDLPKLLAFIDEVQRYGCLVPLLQHRVLKTCKFKGYKIESSDFVFGDLASIMHDPELFENPDDFNIYRFMDESKTKYVPNKSLIPFGVGKRVCLGEGIATMELFLFLSKIVQRFTISLPYKTKIKFHEILEGNTGLVHAPLDHEIIIAPYQP